MVIDKVSSERLAMLRFPLIVGVVFIHAYGTEVGLSGGVVGLARTGYWVDFVRNLVSQGLARIAVPLFFLIAGYFFFIGFSYSLESYGKKVRARIDTLLIPFLFWNVATLLLLALAQFLPATQAYFSGKNDPIVTFGVFDYLNAIFGLNRSPISYQFWFIRDLMVMVLLVPIIYFILKMIPRLFLLAIFTLWFFDWWPVYIPSVAAVAFFYAGAYLAHANISLFSLDRFGLQIVAAYAGILLLDTASKGLAYNSYIHNAGILLGIASLLFVSRMVMNSTKAKQALLWAGGCSFFVFAAHEPLLTVARKFAYKLLAPSNDVAVLSLYFLIPTLVIACCMLLYMGLQLVAPRLLRLISGGR